MADRSSRTVLTTGSNSGIGLATVLEVARLGFRSIGTVRTEQKAAAVHAAAAASGVDVDTVLLDVTDAEGCRRVIDEVRPWGLVNNAGYGGLAAVEDVGDEEASLFLETMVLAPMRLCRLAVPHMRAAGGGRIVNLSSILGRTTAPLAGWYAGAKHALEALSDVLRVEVASSGVKVVLVEPGGFRTGIWVEVGGDAAGRPGTHYDRAYQRYAIGLRFTEPLMGNPRQVARTVGTALTARMVLDRYLVGVDAMALAAARRLTPSPLWDRVVRAGFGL